jgi:hypothetical protein
LSLAGGQACYAAAVDCPGGSRWDRFGLGPIPMGGWPSAGKRGEVVTGAQASLPLRLKSLVVGDSAATVRSWGRSVSLVPAAPLEDGVGAAEDLHSHAVAAVVFLRCWVHAVPALYLYRQLLSRHHPQRCLAASLPRCLAISAPFHTPPRTRSPHQPPSPTRRLSGSCEAVSSLTDTLHHPCAL